MSPFPIIKTINVQTDLNDCLPAGFKFKIEQPFYFQRVPKTFHGRIVVAVRIGIPTTHSTLSPLPNPTPVAPRHRLAYSLHRRTPGEDPESAQPGITRPEPGRTTPPAAYIERLCCISIS